MSAYAEAVPVETSRGPLRTFWRRRRKLLDVVVPPPRPIGARGFGWAGGGGAVSVESLPEWRGTTSQVCGFWPFTTGAGVPTLGVPLGRHLRTGASVCGEPVSWFHRARLISNPSGIVFGRPGLGKSSLARRVALGMAGFGTMPVVVGDLKGEYRDLIAALGGNIVELGRHRGALNPLDMSPAVEAARRAGGRVAATLLADERARVFAAVAGLVAINRRTPLSDHEETVLQAALGVLERAHRPGEATLVDLRQVLEEGPADVRRVTLDRGELDRYRTLVDPLQQSLLALTEGPLGSAFASRTTTPLDLDRPLCIDISSIPESDSKLQAAVLLTCWTAAFGAIESLQMLADEGIEPRRHFFVVLDELWRVLQAGAGLVSRVDAVTRLNRTKGFGQLMLTHTLKDMKALATEEDRQNAAGFLERAGMLFLFGLPRRELVDLREYVGLSDQELDTVARWSSPPGLDTGVAGDGVVAAPPGQGKFLLKVGHAPGVPVQVLLTERERTLYDTNQRWHDTLEVVR